MSRRSLLLALVQLLLVAGLAARYARDRARYPRVWFKALPYDPILPIRGRYIALQLVGLPPANESVRPVAFFIAEHAPDPSRTRQPGEELWAEVTLPPVGPPRPIRLGVKKNGILTPLDIR